MRPILAALILLCGPTLATAQDWDSYHYEATELHDGLWHLLGTGTNLVMSVGEDGVLLVDADYEPMGEKLAAFVRERAGADPDWVLSTHWHYDHVGGNAALAAAGARLAAHENVRRRMAVETHIELLDHVQPPSPAAALPTLTFTDSLTLRFNGEEIVLRHAVAHTDGDAVVHFRGADVIHAGDIFFNCGYPFIDTSCGGDIDGLIAAVASILDLCGEDTVIVPGHGPLATRADLEIYHGLLTDFRAAIRPLKASGMSLEDVKAANATAELDALWGDKMFPPDLFTAMVYLTVD